MSRAKTERPGGQAPTSPKRETAPAPRSAKTKTAKIKAAKTKPTKPAPPAQPVEELGGRDGPDPTRYGDYEKDGRCVDF